MCHWYLNKLNHFSIIYKYANCVCFCVSKKSLSMLGPACRLCWTSVIKLLESCVCLTVQSIQTFLKNSAKNSNSKSV